MHVPLCLCAAIPRIATTTQLVLVAHVREWHQPSNTGRIALLSLAGAELAIWGRRDQPLTHADLAREDARTVILHPSGDAPPLAPAADDPRPLRLLVPDGTWRQSTRMARKLAKMPGFARARLDAPTDPQTQDTSTKLRRAPAQGKLCTGEAIAAALDVLGDHAAAAELRRAVGVMIDRSLFVRGLLPHERVRGGIPLAARRAMSGL